MVGMGAEFIVAMGLLMVMIVLNPGHAGEAIASVSNLINTATPMVLIFAGLNGYVAADTTNRVNTAVTGEHSSGGLMNTIRGAITKPVVKK